MATVLSGPTIVSGEPASGDLSSSLYLFAEFDANGEVQVCDAAGDFADGVIQDTNADAQYKTVQLLVFGPTKLVSGEAITKGDKLTTSNAGKAMVCTPTGSVEADSAILGIALEDVSAADKIFSAIVNCINPGPAT